MDRSTKAAAVFLALFALPFCGFGLGAFFSGMRQVSAGGSKQNWGLMLFGLVFAAIGFALLAAVVLGLKKLKQGTGSQTTNAAQPWLVREDWAQGRANSKTRPSMISAWVFAIFWNLVSAPLLFVIPIDQFVREPKTLVALLFPTIGVGLLIWAFRETLRWVEFGKTYFEMQAVPCLIGRELRGTVQARFPHSPDHGVRLKLSCVNRIVSGSGDNRSTNEKILWREEKTVPSTDLCLGPSGTGIPVSFRIPLDARQTDNTDSRNSILWLLEADADVPGVDYKEIFELPVFRTKDTPSAEEAKGFDSPETASQPPTRPTIMVSPAAEGGTEFYFPAARNKGFAIGTSVFCLFWTGTIWVQIALHAPFIFPLVTGLFDLLLIYIVLQLWLGTARVVIGSGVVAVRSGLLGGGRARQIPFTEVSAIQSAITAQQGGSSGTPYYDIQLVRTNGRKVTLGQTMRDKREVDWLLAEMKRLIGLKAPKAMGAAAQ
jgi:hypothetical protein